MSEELFYFLWFQTRFWYIWWIWNFVCLLMNLWDRCSIYMAHSIYSMCAYVFFVLINSFLVIVVFSLIVSSSLLCFWYPLSISVSAYYNAAGSAASGSNNVVGPIVAAGRHFVDATVLKKSESLIGFYHYSHQFVFAVYLCLFPWLSWSFVYRGCYSFGMWVLYICFASIAPPFFIRIFSCQLVIS